MKKGYYTDLQNNVLGYWELKEKPVDDDKHLWIESAECPALYVSTEQSKAQELAECHAFLANTDYKILRQQEQSTLSTVEYAVLLADRQAKRDRINELEAL